MKTIKNMKFKELKERIKNLRGTFIIENGYFMTVRVSDGETISKELIDTYYINECLFDLLFVNNHKVVITVG